MINGDSFRSVDIGDVNWNTDSRDSEVSNNYRKGCLYWLLKYRFMRIVFVTGVMFAVGFIVYFYVFAEDSVNRQFDNRGPLCYYMKDRLRDLYFNKFRSTDMTNSTTSNFNSMLSEGMPRLISLNDSMNSENDFIDKIRLIFEDIDSSIYTNYVYLYNRNYNLTNRKSY